MYLLESTGQCMAVKLTLTHFCHHHHASTPISSAGNSVCMNVFCMLDLASFTSVTDVGTHLCTPSRNLIPLLLILHYQLDLCAACLKQKCFQCSRPCRVLIGYPWTSTTELRELLPDILFGDFLVQWGMACSV